MDDADDTAGHEGSEAVNTSIGVDREGSGLTETEARVIRKLASQGLKLVDHLSTDFSFFILRAKHKEDDFSFTLPRQAAFTLPDGGLSAEWLNMIEDYVVALGYDFLPLD